MAKKKIDGVKRGREISEALYWAKLAERTAAETARTLLECEWLRVKTQQARDDAKELESIQDQLRVLRQTMDELNRQVHGIGNVGK